MATKHTPGPWFVNSFQVWAEKEGKRFGTLLASLRNTHTGDTVANADAALIAAAPELLAELQAIADYIDKAGDPMQIAADMYASNPKMKDLIRKATQP